MVIKPTINVLGQDITIKFRKNLIVEDEHPDTKQIYKEKCLGVFISGTNTIYLDADLKDRPTKRDDTFFHELVECILTLLEIDIEVHSKITQLATPLFGILKQLKLLKPFDFNHIQIEEDSGPI